ncbi:hypothetical protein GCM10010156_75070 [Planobispora rosea]|uniref:Uncharacterized protein n=1 Tax=Planobispora rosea TaxID=35762 RepID=A0A8J3S994_PLARO|nr:hypothetical protein GCM10010156_75070 [Planobispora rosea]GIH89040.1 hypothetical protein Pro02_74480 [Planobispora rosea]
MREAVPDGFPASPGPATGRASSIPVAQAVSARVPAPASTASRVRRSLSLPTENPLATPPSGIPGSLPAPQNLRMTPA